jgi:hypothetical protein
MATTSHPQSHRPRLDPDQFEQAGRRFRHWLNALAAPRTPPVVKAQDDIAWEDGEPPSERRPDAVDQH